MIDSNISMEEDTELRDLVVQTLDSNGTLAKVRVRLPLEICLPFVIKFLFFRRNSEQVYFCP